MPTPKTMLTPKELADAIGASESSLRRWIDKGEIEMSRTAGGHRRIPMTQAIAFIRKMGATIIRPDLLGLGEIRDGSAIIQAAPPGVSDAQILFNQLVAGERQVVRGLLESWYLAGRSLPEMLDGPVRSAMQHVGELWNHEERGILLEHQATEICLEAIAALRAMVPVADEGAAVAIGGAPEGDPYQVPSRMAALVLAEIGFREVNFGARTPVELLASEAVRRGARLVWLSVSTKLDEAAMRAAIRSLAETLHANQIPLVIGGRHGRDYAPSDLANVTIVDSMAELAKIAKQIRDGAS